MALSVIMQVDGLVTNYSGPTNLNNFLHSFPHCTFDHGCHYIPFTNDPDTMVEFHKHDNGQVWLESLMMIGFVPLAVMLLYLIIDSISRCASRCCGSKSSDCCCCGSKVDDDASEKLLVSSRVTFGSRASYGAFPNAIEPAGLSHNPKRGGVAGQTADAFHSSPRLGPSAIDSDNPFHTSSRLVSVSRVEAHDEVVIPRKNPDAGYDSRMLAAVILSVIALTLLSVSIAFSQGFSTEWSDVRGNLEATQLFMQYDLQQNGVQSSQTDCTNIQQGLQNLLAAGMASAQPFDEGTQAQLMGLASSYGLIASSVLQPFSDALQNQTNHIDDARSWMNDVEKVREDTTYSLLSLLMFFVVLVIVVHIYYRQKTILSLFVKVLFSFLIGLVAWVWAVGLIASIGASDVCQDPLTYAHSALNSSYVREDQGVDELGISTAQFYLNCWQDVNETSAARNPLTIAYYETYVFALDSSVATGGLDNMITYIDDNRPDLVQYSTLLTSLNGTVWSDTIGLGNNLGCEKVHGYFMKALEHSCHDLVDRLYIATVMQFFSCILLIFVMCLVWMRRRKTSEFVDDEDDTPFAAQKDQHGSGSGSSEHDVAQHPIFGEVRSTNFQSSQRYVTA